MGRNTSDNVRPRIYVADLSAYNSGYLHGIWIDATQDSDDIRAEIAAMLKRSPVSDAEEYAIHDYEGFGDLKLSEYEDLENVARVAQLISEHGELFTALLSYYGGTDSMDDAVRALEESYQGAYDSLEDWAENFADDTGASAEQYRSYIDWERVGRDAELGGDVFTVETSDGKVHVFWSH